MIVQRINARYKVGKLQEANDLLKAERARLFKEKPDLLHAFRLYTPLASDADVSIGEYEFENNGAMEKFWRNWKEQPEAQVFLQKYTLLLEGEMVNEYFDLL